MLSSNRAYISDLLDILSTIHTQRLLFLKYSKPAQKNIQKEEQNNQRISQETGYEQYSYEEEWDPKAREKLKNESLKRIKEIQEDINERGYNPSNPNHPNNPDNPNDCNVYA